jgi:hypothetical protein
MGVNPKKVVLIAFLFSTAYKLCTFRCGAIYRVYLTLALRNKLRRYDRCAL